MKNIEILDRDFNRLCWMSNEPEQGLHFYADYLSTSVDTGVYMLDFKVPKRINDGVHNDKMQYLKENNYLRFVNRQNVPILMNIKTITENRDEKIVGAEDTSLALANSMSEAMETPQEPQPIEFYLEPVLNKVGFYIGTNESETKQIVDLSTDQKSFERVKQIMQAFGMEFYIRVEFSDLNKPRFYVHVVKQRLEGEAGFRLSSDDSINRIERDVNADNIRTKLIMRGRTKETEVVGNASETEENEQEEQVDNNIESVISIARQQLGKPYLWGGNGPHSFDCSGFVSYAFRSANYPGYPTTGRPTTYSVWNGEHSSYFTKISKSELKRGDIIMYDTYYVQTKPNHVGIYLGNDQVIHAGSPVKIQGAHSMTVVGYLRVKR